jgi:hypothetical protein
MNNLKEYELLDMYRQWWSASYGTQPNNQAAVMAASFAAHVLASVNKPVPEITQEMVERWHAVATAEDDEPGLGLNSCWHRFAVLAVTEMVNQ